MAKTKMSAEQATNMCNAIALNGGELPAEYAQFSVEEMWEVLESTPDSGFEMLNADYWKPAKNKTYNMFFDGMTTLTIEGKSVEAARLRDKDGKKYVFGGSLLVNSVRNMVPPAFIRVNVLDEVQSGKNKYLDLKVLTMPGTKFKTPVEVQDAEVSEEGGKKDDFSF